VSRSIQAGASEPTRLRLLRQAQEVGGVSPGEFGELPVLGQPVQAVFPDRLEHHEPGLALIGVDPPDQALVDQ
jgi:hypothetical protein